VIFLDDVAVEIDATDTGFAIQTIYSKRFPPTFGAIVTLIIALAIMIPMDWRNWGPPQNKQAQSTIGRVTQREWRARQLSKANGSGVQSRQRIYDRARAAQLKP